MMRFFDKSKGTVSVFLIMIMLPMYSCVSLAVYAVRLKSAENEFKEIMGLTANAALSDYDRTLMELYGLTAFSYDGKNREEYKKLVLQNYPETKEFFISLSDEMMLSRLDNYEKAIKVSMIYKAPYNWGSLVSQKFSLFTQLSQIERVIKKCSGYFKVISSTKNSIMDIYSSIAAVNLNESNSDIIKKLKNIMRSAQALTGDLEKIDKEAASLKASIDEIKNGELRALLETDCNSSSDYLSSDSLKEFQTKINEDIDRITSLDEKVSLSDLSFTESTFYEYVTVSGAEGKKTEGDEEGKTFKASLETIEKFDLKEIAGKISDTSIRTLVSEDVYSKIMDFPTKSDVFSSLSGLSSIGLSQAYVAEFFSDRFTCLTSENTEKVWLPETEYLLFGNENMRTNVELCIDSIFAIRMILNSVFALTNTRMRQTALSVAAAVAGMTGPGVSVAKNLILLSWAAAESVTDTYLLCKGETIPVYKTMTTWNLTLENVPKLLEEGITSFTGKVVDDVFSQIEQFSAGNVSKVSKAVSGYIENTSLGIAETIASTVATPVENKITLLISGVKVNYSREDIKKILKKIVDDIPCDSDAVRMAKDYFCTECLDSLASYIYERLPGVFSSDEELYRRAYAEIKGAIDSLYERLMEKINSELKRAEKKVNDEISKMLGSAKGDIKGRMRDTLDEYTKEVSLFAGEKKINTSGKGELISSSFMNTSGVSMSYEDYLKLFLYLRLLGENSKRNILKRSQIIVQLNCENKKRGFNILNCGTGVRLGGKIHVFEKEIIFEKTYSY